MGSCLQKSSLMSFKWLCIGNPFCSFINPTLTCTCASYEQMPPPDTVGRKGSSSFAFWCSVLPECNHFLLWFWICTHIATAGTQACIFRSLSENEASRFLKINLCRAKAGINEQEGDGGHKPFCLLVCYDSQGRPSQPPSAADSHFPSSNEWHRSQQLTNVETAVKYKFPTLGNLVPDKCSWKLVECACLFQGPP